ncbi:MAG: hypothetical protein HWE21_04745 [Cytophagia bacterium]|nr:hypothetical protein [Cytophagia bacterium]
MEEPNEDILLLESDAFLLKSKTIEMLINGKLLFKWYPAPSVILQGESQSQSRDNFFNLFKDDYDGTFQLFVDSDPIGQLHLLNWSSNNSVKFIVIKELKIPKFSKCDRITFKLPNFPQLLIRNKSLKMDDPLINGVLLMHWDDYQIQLKPVDGHFNKYKRLKEIGGYIITHSGELTRTEGKRSINKHKWDQISDGLSFFLSFACGALTRPILEEGYLKERNVWKDVSGRLLRRYKGYFESVLSKRDADFLIEYWPKFMAIWVDEKQRPVLRDVLHWYLEAKSNSDYSNNSIVLSQISLEILFQWVVKSRRKALDKNSNLTAANQFRLLLSLLNVEINIPKKFDLIIERVKGDQKLFDGIDFIVQVRNSQVHFNDNRKNYTTMELYQCKELFLYYIECSVIAILDEQV